MRCPFYLHKSRVNMFEFMCGLLVMHVLHMQSHILDPVWYADACTHKWSTSKGTQLPRCGPFISSVENGIPYAIFTMWHIFNMVIMWQHSTQLGNPTERVVALLLHMQPTSIGWLSAMWIASATVLNFCLCFYPQHPYTPLDRGA